MSNTSKKQAASKSKKTAVAFDAKPSLSSNVSSSPVRLRVGIVGLGMVGTPIKEWFEKINGYTRGKDLFLYDADPAKKFNDDMVNADVIFVAVPTPPGKNGACDISILQKACARLPKGKIVIVKSTVAPGTVEGLQAKYPESRFIFNPEFLTESMAWEDFIKPERQLLGHTAASKGDTSEIMAILPRAFFSRPWQSDYSKKDISATEAELVKYASNVFGYIKVIYGNILADICYATERDYAERGISGEIDYERVRESLGADSRIGPSWLNVAHGNYNGAGGYCFPKDMKALIAHVDELTKRISKIKAADQKQLIKVMTAGNAVLKAVQSYNEVLLGWQNLTIKEVSAHNKDLILKKHKNIRAENKK